MNFDWMRQKLEDFLALCEQYDAASGPEYNRATRKPIQDKIDDEVPTVQRIIGQLDPSLLIEGFGTAWHPGGLSETIRMTRRALAVVRHREEWKVESGPRFPIADRGRTSPKHLGGCGQDLEAGEYKHAAQSACTSLSDHIKKRAGSHLNDRRSRRPSLQSGATYVEPEQAALPRRPGRQKVAVPATRVAIS